MLLAKLSERIESVLFIAGVAFLGYHFTKPGTMLELPQVPPIPSGWEYAKGVPSVVTQRCIALLSKPDGYTEKYWVDGVTYLLRREPHYDTARGWHAGVTAFTKKVG